MGEIGNRNGGHQINRPRHWPPVEQAVSRRPAYRFGRTRLKAERRALVVIHPFQNSPVEDTRADTAAKHHRRPRAGFEFDIVFRFTQLDVADVGTADIGNEYQREHAEG